MPQTYKQTNTGSYGGGEFNDLLGGGGSGGMDLSGALGGLGLNHACAI